MFRGFEADSCEFIGIHCNILMNFILLGENVALLESLETKTPSIAT